MAEYNLSVFNSIFSHGDEIAVRYRGVCVSYAELCENAKAFAAYLLSKYAGNADPVVIYAHKENEILPIVLACGLTGHAFVPVDITNPHSRLEMIIEEANPCVVVDFTGGGLNHRFDSLDLDGVRAVFKNHAEFEIKEPADSAPCYVLFTSGSTGKPKGVRLSYGNLRSYLRGFKPYFLKDETAIVLNCTSYSFDVSWGYIFPSLIAGYTLYTVDKDSLGSMPEMFAEFSLSGANAVMCTPSLIDMCLVSQKFGASILPNMQSFILAGEVLTNEFCRKLRSRFPQAQILNAYGPTEAMVLATAAVITDEMIADSRPIPIGYSFEGLDLRIVSEDGTEAAEEEHGQLIIIGDSVSEGYLNRPELTEKVFFIDETTRKRAYRTGDDCYRIGDLIYYCGRQDLQVKLNGYRIELDDIENNLVKIPYIARATVVPLKDSGRVTSLAAFIVLSERTETSDFKQSNAVRRDLAAITASYMVPRKIFIVEDFPYTVTGKVDRLTLGKIAAGEVSGGGQ